MLSILRSTGSQTRSTKFWKSVKLSTSARCMLDRNSSSDQNKIVDMLLKSSRLEPTKQGNIHNNDFNKNFVIHDTVGLPEVTKSHIPFPHIEYNDYDTTDMENLGRLYLKYITVRYIFNTRPHIRFNEAIDYSETLLEHALMDFDFPNASFLEYIGQFCITDISKCNQVMESFFMEDSKSSQFIELFPYYFQKISPTFNSDQLDYSLIWDTTITNSTFEFPKLECARRVFNPLYIVGSSSVSQFLTSPIFERTLESKPVREKLLNLKNYGKLIFEFYTVNHLFRKLDVSNPLFINIIRNMNSIFEDIIAFSALRNVINCQHYSSTMKTIPSSSTSNEIFYQYVGILDINNRTKENLVERWVGRLVDYMIINSNETNTDSSIKYIKTPLTPPKFKKQKNLPIVPSVSISEVLSEKIFPHGYADSTILAEITKLGQSSISLAFRQYLVTTRLGETEYEKYKYERDFSDVVIRHIDGSIKVKNITPLQFSNCDIPFASNQFLGLFLIHDFDGCLKFLRGFFIEDYNPSSFEDSVNYMKWLAYQIKLPTFRMANNAMILTKSNPLELPPLTDSSRITRFLLLNNSVIKPSFGSYKNKNWKRNNSIKNCLYSWHSFGNLLYKVSIQQALICKLSQISSPYIQELFKLLTSNNFCKYLLDNSNVFNKIENIDYKTLLMEKRYTNSLINAQFSQYLAALHISNPILVKEWTLSLADLFINVIENLNSEEVLHLINRFTFEFRNHKFSLSQNFTRKTIKNIEEKGIIIDLPAVLELNKISIRLLEEVGKSFLSYTIASFNIHYGLDSFINAKLDTIQMVEEVVTTSLFKGLLGDKSFFQYVGLLVYQKGNVETQKLLFKLLEQLLNNKARPLDLSKIPNLDLIVKDKIFNVSDFSVWRNEIQFPQMENNDSLHKLLLVNFYVSRTFLQITKSHGGNINELPDLCTKFNTIGGEFYKYLIIKHAYTYYLEKHSPISEVIIEKSIKLLLDRIFMSIVCYKSDILYDPFNLKDYAKLAKKAMKNNYFFLRFSSQSFKQYMGSLCYNDLNIADEWVGSIVNTLLNELSIASTIQKQHELLNNLESKMHKYYIHKHI